MSNRETATFIRRLTSMWRGDARLYKLSTPIRIDPDVRHILDQEGVKVPDTLYVVVSAIENGPQGPNTAIFYAHEDGEAHAYKDENCLAYGYAELMVLDHEQVLNHAGYDVIRNAQSEPDKNAS